jgi:hypothetical protein
MKLIASSLSSQVDIVVDYGSKDRKNFNSQSLLANLSSLNSSRLKDTALISLSTFVANLRARAQSPSNRSVMELPPPRPLGEM